MTASLFTQRIQAWLGITILAQMLTTPRLWFVMPPDRPVFVPMVLAAPGWLHLILSGLLAGAAFALVLRPRHRQATLWVVGLLVVLCVLDELRLQPWAWLLMLAGVLLFEARRRDGRLGDVFLAQHMRLLLVGLYLWAALHKVNAGFFAQTVPFFLEPFGFNDPSAALRGGAGAVIIGSELALASFLWRAQSMDRYALRFGVALHLGVIAILGPAGQNYDPNVWTWNLSQAVLLILLLYKGGSSVPVIKALRAKARPTLVLASLVLLMPALHVVRLAPANLSWALYAGNYDVGFLAATYGATSPELQRAVVPFPPHIVRATYRFLEPQLGDVEGLQDVAYPPQIMKELGVTYPPDAGFIRRLHQAMCAELEPILILRPKDLPFVPNTKVSIERCDGSRVETAAPPFL